MVLTRSMAAAARRAALALPHDMVVEIAGHVAASSPRPMEDICSLRATCQAMRAACEEDAVGRRVALEQEHAMRWFENDRYLALVHNLAGVGNPEACFVLGLTLVFAQARAGPGAEWLRRAAAAGHKVAAYVLAVLCYTDKTTRGDAEQYMRQAAAADDGGVRESQLADTSKVIRECMACRAQAVHAVRDLAWKGVIGRTVPEPVVPPEEDDEGQLCEGSGCGVPEGWSGVCAVFCSNACRIRREYSEFFSRVPLPVSQ